VEKEERKRAENKSHLSQPADPTSKTPFQRRLRKPVEVELSSSPGVLMILPKTQK
jgi:hypothetical protein